MAGSSLVSNYSHLLGENFVRILDYELLGNIKQLITLVDDRRCGVDGDEMTAEAES